MITLTNVGTAYDAVVASQNLQPAMLDFTNAVSLTVTALVAKVGTGTLTWQVYNETDGSEIGHVTDAGASGQKQVAVTIDLTTLNPLLTGLKGVRIRCKSTVGTDSPVFGSALYQVVRDVQEAFNLLLHINAQTARLARNMRANATDYIARANAIAAGTAPAGRTLAGLISDMQTGAAANLVRIQTMTDIVARNLTLVTNALAIIGAAIAPANTLKATLTDAATHVQNATYVTAQDCIDASNYVLTNVPNYDGLLND